MLRKLRKIAKEVDGFEKVLSNHVVDKKLSVKFGADSSNGFRETLLA